MSYRFNNAYAFAAMLCAVSFGTQATTIELIDATTISSIIPNDGNQFIPALSSDGRYVVFSSTATTLDANDQNGNEDVYLFDTATNALTLVSHTPAGHGGNSYSSGAHISADGSVVVFYSAASDLVAGDTNACEDLFLWTRQTGIVTRIAQPSGGESNGSSFFPRLTPDGHYLTFTSVASNLVPGDVEGFTDTFRLDMSTGAIIRVNTAADGTPANGNSRGSDISDDGNVVLFASTATNLVPGDTNTNYDYYLKNITTGAIHLVSRDASGNSTNAYMQLLSWGRRISADGSKAVFVSNAAQLAGYNSQVQAYLYDDSTGTVSLLSQNSGTPSNGGCDDVRISADASTAYFSCYGTSLLATNNYEKVFVRNLSTGMNSLISTTSAGGQLNGNSYGPAMADGGGFVAFLSTAQVLLGSAPNTGFQVYLNNMTSGQVTSPSELAATSSAPAANNSIHEVHVPGPSISADGRYAAFSSDASNLVGGDTNNATDVFVRDRQAQTTTRVSLTSAAAQANCGSDTATITPDARYVAFTSCAALTGANDTNNTYDAFRYDRSTGQVVLASANPSGNAGNSLSYVPHISDDGNILVFASYATDLIAVTAHHAYIFARDIQAGTTQRISVGMSGTEANVDSYDPVVSGNGNVVAYSSSATNVANTTDGHRHVYAYDRTAGTTEQIDVNPLGQQPNGYGNGVGGLSSDGRYVAFASRATNLTGATVPSNTSEVYLRDRVAQTTILISKRNDGMPLDIWNYQPHVSADGAYVSFISAATNYDPISSDYSYVYKIFVYDVANGLLSVVNRSADDDSSNPHLSTDGKHVVFVSYADNLSPLDGNGRIQDVFAAENYLDEVFKSGFE
jgi:hypothetical protein